MSRFMTARSRADLAATGAAIVLLTLYAGRIADAGAALLMGVL